MLKSAKRRAARNKKQQEQKDLKRVINADLELLTDALIDELIESRDMTSDELLMLRRQGMMYNRARNSFMSNWEFIG
jgi:hypothetical protein